MVYSIVINIGGFMFLAQTYDYSYDVATNCFGRVSSGGFVCVLNMDAICACYSTSGNSGVVEDFCKSGATRLGSNYPNL